MAKEDLSYGDVRIAAGKFVAASPAVSNRIPEDFPEPDSFVRPATSNRARKIGPTRGRGSPSAPAATAASAPPSP